ncbi:hypothetical protein ASC76_05555 [Rhizobacter sp. Root404]|nr:hypothetical protein ASC76_05555 [Rhizobacter sp. Root404]
MVVVWLRRLAWVVGAVLLLWIAVWLAVPPLLKWQLPLRASEALGRPVTLGAVSFHPWTLELALSDLAVGGPAPASEPLLKVGRLRADVSTSSLFRLAPVIEALDVDGLRVRVARTAEGHYDIDDLITRFTPKPDAKPDAEPARFALYNLQVRDAQLRFDDRPVQRVHNVDALQLTLPFISNLPAQVQVKVEPRLAFRLNGTPFDSGAQATPFAQTRAGDLKLAMTDLDLAPYLPYLPASLPVRVTQGRVSADIALSFSVPPGSAPSVALKGMVGARDLALTDAGGAPLAAWRQLSLRLSDVQPLARKVGLDSLKIDGLHVHASRDAAGRINLLRLATPGSAAASAPVSVAAASAASAASAAARRAEAPAAWQASLESLDLADARVLWSDAAVQPAAALQLDGLSIVAKQLRWPLDKAVNVSVKGALRSAPSGTAPRAAAAAASAATAFAEFTAAGPVTDHDARLDVSISRLSLGMFAPYLAQALVPSVAGQLAAQARLDWSGAADAPRLQLSVDQLALDDLKVREARPARNAPDAVALKQLALAGLQVDLLARNVTLGSVKLVQPVVYVTRDREGRLNVERWVVDQPAASRPADPPARPGASTAPWRVQVKDFLLDGGQVRFADEVVRRGVSEPVRAEVANLRAAMQNVEWHGDRAVPAASVQLSGRVGGVTRDRQRANGTFDYKGRVGLQPLLANGNLKVERVPVQLFKPYFADLAQLTLQRAEVGYVGKFDVRQLANGLDASAAGDVLLGDVHVSTLPEKGAPASVQDGEELLSWQSFALKGVKVAMKPKARPRIEIGEAALSDFYSRLVITEQGRFNLQDVAAGSAPEPVPLGGVAPASPPASAVVASAPASAPPAERPEGELPVDLRIGGTTLTNGRVDFTDRFVRPNYSAALTELNGTLGAFSSGTREMATVALRGRAAGTALLEISGQVNPTVKPLALDIQAKATDLELAPLSPYAGKYVGYAIERGKLTMDVAYKIDADGKLDARNQVVLNQLTFGDKIESKDATKLPVLLAVALLKDRNGVIDINLPVSGSVNDPQFRVGAIIWKVIVNLLTKAITSPFALLGGGGGGDDLSLVEFKPGTAQITGSGAGAIDKVAKALTDRPSLKMTVTGAADPNSEREAFQAAALEARLIAQQRREGLRNGATVAPAPASGAASAAPAPVVLGAEERARLLKEVYKDTDLPNKPRNLIGFAKDIPGPEMEALLKGRAPVTAEAMRELALQRGIAVRDALIAKGLPSERLFLAAPKLRVSGEDDASWTPRVQLSLAVN